MISDSKRSVVSIFAQGNADRKLAQDASNPSPQELEVLVQQRTAALRSLSARLLRVQDEERRRLARELHDSTGQTLTALKIQLANLQKYLAGDQLASEAFAQVNALADQALQEIRTTSYLLYPPLLEETGFCCAARWYVEGFSKRSNIQVGLHLASIERLSRPIEIALFRILQETLTNVYRHSASQTVDIRLSRDAGTATLEVQDYGQGIPARLLDQFKRAGSGTGVGLAGMRERIEDLGGQLEIKSGRAGTVVRTTVPVAAVPAGCAKIADSVGAVAS
jgi:two-component system, NarL family, sensor kinase